MQNLHKTHKKGVFLQSKNISLSKKYTTIVRLYKIELFRGTP